MHVDLLILDVDGVMTDGSITLDAQGRESKTFHVRDGFGIRLWRELGGEVAIITGRAGEVVEHRAKELGIHLVFKGVKDKAAALDDVTARSGITPERAAALGDDWPDLPVLGRVAYPMAVADASPEVILVAKHVTRSPGGRGAVREAVEHLLERRGDLERARTLYRARSGGSGA